MGLCIWVDEQLLASYLVEEVKLLEIYGQDGEMVGREDEQIPRYELVSIKRLSRETDKYLHRRFCQRA
jgi:hypothetical protein